MGEEKLCLSFVYVDTVLGLHCQVMCTLSCVLVVAAESGERSSKRSRSRSERVCAGAPRRSLRATLAPALFCRCPHAACAAHAEAAADESPRAEGDEVEGLDRGWRAARPSGGRSVLTSPSASTEPKRRLSPSSTVAPDHGTSTRAGQAPRRRQGRATPLPAASPHLDGPQPSSRPHRHPGPHRAAQQLPRPLGTPSTNARTSSSRRISPSPPRRHPRPCPSPPPR